MTSSFFMQANKFRLKRMKVSGATVSYTVIGDKVLSIGEITITKVRIIFSPVVLILGLVYLRLDIAG